jgi:hypothetical protein
MQLDNRSTHVASVFLGEEGPSVAYKTVMNSSLHAGRANGLLARACLDEAMGKTEELQCFLSSAKKFWRSAHEKRIAPIEIFDLIGNKNSYLTATMLV